MSKKPVEPAKKKMKTTDNKGSISIVKIIALAKILSGAFALFFDKKDVPEPPLKRKSSKRTQTEPLSQQTPVDDTTRETKAA